MGEEKKKMGTMKNIPSGRTQRMETKPNKIFILHGWTYDTSKWGPFLLGLQKNGVEGVMLKIPGLTSKLEKPWTLDNYVSWLQKELANEKEVTILGHSNGGRIALSYSLLYPSKVKNLILIDSAGIFHNELLLRFKRATFKGVAKLGKKIAPATFKPLLYKLIHEHDYERANPILQETMRNLISVHLQPQLKHISLRTTIIWGENDKITPFQDALTMHLLIKDSQLYPIAHAKHSPQFTHPEEVAKIVINSLTKA